MIGERWLKSRRVARGASLDGSVQRMSAYQDEFGCAWQRLITLSVEKKIVRLSDAETKMGKISNVDHTTILVKGKKRPIGEMDYQEMLETQIILGHEIRTIKNNLDEADSNQRVPDWYWKAKYAREIKMTQGDLLELAIENERIFLAIEQEDSADERPVSSFFVDLVREEMEVDAFSDLLKRAKVQFDHSKMDEGRENDPNSEI
jgi:hypothetical protein